VIWVALWVVLVVGAAVILGRLGRDVWRKGKVLAADVADASILIERAMTPLQEAVDEYEEHERRREELAVFDNPELLRRDHARDRAKAAKRKAGAASAHRSNGRHRLDPGTSRFGAISQGATRPSTERTT
jgi:hypothetical protein